MSQYATSREVENEVYSQLKERFESIVPEHFKILDVSGAQNFRKHDVQKTVVMLEKVLDKQLWKDEKIDHFQVRFTTWDRPEVKVWCKSSDFNYENSRVVEERALKDGKLFRFTVDVRPF